MMSVEASFDGTVIGKNDAYDSLGKANKTILCPQRKPRTSTQQ